MSRLGTQISLTGRDQSHEGLGVLEANFQALLNRRWVEDYDNFKTQLDDLDRQIQNLRSGAASDLLAQWGREIARREMETFFDQFLTKVEATPKWVHDIARVINPDIDIEAFEISPAAEFWWEDSVRIINEMMNGEGPFEAMQHAVEWAKNTDLYVLFSLYSASRTAYKSAQNPRGQRINEEQITNLERQRAYLMRVNDELKGAYNAFDKKETQASAKTWASRVTTFFAWAATAVVLGWVKLPSFSTTPDQSWGVHVTVNVGTSVSLGHTVVRASDGSLIYTPEARTNAIEISWVTFQLDWVKVSDKWEISGKVNYMLPWGQWEVLNAKTGDNILSNGKILWLKKGASWALEMTYWWTSQSLK